jgi:hypothetical protein
MSTSRVAKVAAARQQSAAKVTPAKVTPIKPAPTTPATAPSTPAAESDTLDLFKLANTVKAVDEAPKRTRGAAGGAAQVFKNLIEASAEDGKWRVVGPVNTNDAKSMQRADTAIRNGGKLAKLRVNVVKELAEDGTLFYFQGKPKTDTAVDTTPTTAAPATKSAPRKAAAKASTPAK